MSRGPSATSKVDLEELLYDEWRWQRGLLRRLLNDIEADPEVGSCPPAAQHTWERLEALAEASQRCAGEPVWQKSRAWRGDQRIVGGTNE